jgi:3-hydroxyacyl-[acyl-carrier-protein] dehydratase
MRFSWSGEISPDHPALPGHFPGNPVVPGAMLLSQVLHAVQEECGMQVKISAMPAVKFHAALRPAEKFEIELQALGEGRMKFTVSRGDTLIATGSLCYEGILPLRESS